MCVCVCEMNCLLKPNATSPPQPLHVKFPTSPPQSELSITLQKYSFTMNTFGAIDYPIFLSKKFQMEKPVFQSWALKEIKYGHLDLSKL